MKDFLDDGVLVCCMEQEASLALIRSGQLLDHRHLPFSSDAPAAEAARTIHREAKALGRTQQATGTGLQLMGPSATPELLAELNKHPEQVTLLSLELGGELIEAKFLPAVALALRAEQGHKASSFNLRQGSFALQGEGSSLRKPLLIAACLAGLILGVVSTTMGLRYLDKQQQANQLQAEMVAIFQKTFPKATTVVDVPLQFQSALRQLQEEGGIIGHDRPSALQLLRVLSDLPQGLDYDVDEMILERNELRISGQTSSFETVNRMAEQYRQAACFEKVEVTEAKMALDGNQVSYRMRLLLHGKGTSS